MISKNNQNGKLVGNSFFYDSFCALGRFWGGMIMAEKFDKIAIGQRIRESREKKGIRSQEDLAEMLNEYSEKNGLDLKHFNREDIKRWENGDQDLKMSVLFALSKVLEEDCNFLITGTESNFAVTSNQLGFSQKVLQKITRAEEPAFSSGMFGNWNDQINFVFDHDLEFVLNELLHYWDFSINGKDHLERHIRARNSREDVELIISETPEETDPYSLMLNQLIFQGYPENEALQIIDQEEQETEAKKKYQMALLIDQGKTEEEAREIISQVNRSERIRKEESEEYIQRIKLFKLEKAIDKAAEMLKAIKQEGSGNGKARKW